MKHEVKELSAHSMTEFEMEVRDLMKKHNIVESILISKNSNDDIACSNLITDEDTPVDPLIEHLYNDCNRTLMSVYSESEKVTWGQKEVDEFRKQKS